MKNKEKWGVKSDYSEYTDSDKDFDEKNYDEKNRLGDTDFYGFQKPDGSWVILEEDMKWTVPAGMDKASLIKALEAFDKNVEAKRNAGEKYTADDWQKAATDAINGSIKGNSKTSEKEFDVDAAAMDVIRGKYKNGQERKDALGEDYEMVQKRVNELMKAQKSSSSKSESKSSSTKKLKHTDMGVYGSMNDWREYQYEEYLAHHGIKGQKWGVRRFQNKDGSLNAAGKKRYGDTSETYNAVKNARKAQREAYSQYNRSFNKAANTSVLRNLTKKGREIYNNRWDKAAEDADKYETSKAATKAAKQAYKDAYNKNLETARANQSRADKLLYNDATNKRAAKLMTKYADYDYNKASEQAKKEAKRNTAAVLAAYAAISAASIYSVSKMR